VAHFGLGICGYYPSPARHADRWRRRRDAVLPVFRIPAVLSLEADSRFSTRNIAILRRGLVYPAVGAPGLPRCHSTRIWWLASYWQNQGKRDLRSFQILQNASIATIKCVDCEDNPRSQRRHGHQRFRLDGKIAGARVCFCLYSDTKVSDRRSIPSIAVNFRQGSYEGAKCPDGGVRGFGDLSRFEIRTEVSSVASNIEDVHLPAENVDERAGGRTVFFKCPHHPVRQLPALAQSGTVASPLCADHLKLTRTRNSSSRGQYALLRRVA
jgi:hypothetical protein